VAIVATAMNCGVDQPEEFQIGIRMRSRCGSAARAVWRTFYRAGYGGAHREVVINGLKADLLLHRRRSAGKYDVVEECWRIWAEFFFDAWHSARKPLVFGRRAGLFFRLPGNPSSTMVTFEVFARAALELLAGRKRLRCTAWARLTREFRHAPGDRFLRRG